jgi:putative ABC transport system permease protein
MFDTAWQDVRHGVRLFAKSPGFSLIAVVSIAIGVGANTAMFSIADGLVLRPLPLPDPRDVVVVTAITPTGEAGDNGLSYPDYADLRDRARSFEGLTAWRGLMASFTRHRDEAAQSKFGLAVSANFFDVLRVRPALGRAFLPDEDRVSGRDPVVVLSHETWTEQFGADQDIVGREVRLTGQSFTVIGVAPEEFTGVEFYLRPAFYVPIAMVPALDPTAQPDVLDRRDVRRLSVMGRLQQGVSLTQAGQDVDSVARALEQEHPLTNQRHGLLVRREMDARFAEYAPMAGLSAILIGLAGRAARGLRQRRRTAHESCARARA